MKSTCKWIEGMKSTVDNGRGHTVTLDLPSAQGGTDEGATALELAVMGLSGCVGTIFALVAKNSKVEFSALEVELDAEKPDSAKTVTAAKAIVRVKSAAAEDRLERILKKTMELCPVGVLFEQAGIHVEHELIVE